MESSTSLPRKTLARKAADALLFALAHAETVLLFLFLRLFAPVLRESVAQTLQARPLPPGWNFFACVLPDWSFLLLVPSFAMWWLMRRCNPVVRYVAVLSWNVQLFACSAVVYAFFFCVIRLPYVPVLSLP